MGPSRVLWQRSLTICIGYLSCLAGRRCSKCFHGSASCCWEATSRAGWFTGLVDVSFFKRGGVRNYVSGAGKRVPAGESILGRGCVGVVYRSMLLLTPYASFFGLKLDARFLLLTASAHLVFGVALGLYCQRRLRMNAEQGLMIGRAGHQ
jgi:hypothetical protein